jgi:hypothetical protein
MAAMATVAMAMAAMATAVPEMVATAMAATAMAATAMAATGTAVPAMVVTATAATAMVVMAMVVTVDAEISAPARTLGSTNGHCSARCGGGIQPPPALLAGVFLALSLVSVVAAEDEFYPPREDWAQYWDGDLNISVFVFRDINRDGVYDVGDQPMSGIVVDAESQRSGETAWSSSNGSGFANFTMSGSDPETSIRSDGVHVFTVHVPDGWNSTTHNLVQPIRFITRPGSPADMIAITAPALVGLAPELTISGTMPAPGNEAGLAGPAGESVLVSADDNGDFVIPVEAGDWHCRAVPDLSFTVATVPVRIARQWWEGEGASGPETIVTFDDLQSEGVLKIPSGYNGVNWDNFVMTHRKFYEPEGYRNGVMSGEFLAYNGSGHPASISSTEPFDFIGGYFGVSSLDAEGETLSITGWQGDVQAFHEDLTLSAIGPVYLAADFENVTRLEFRTAHYWQFTVDNLSLALSANGPPTLTSSRR